MGPAKVTPFPPCYIPWLWRCWGQLLEIVRIGVCLPGLSEESKISQYADNGNLTLVDEYSITKAFEIVRTFEKGSGSKLSLDKTEGMWISSMAGRTDGPVNIKQRTNFIKVLGIFFTMFNCDFLSLNWNFRIEKLAKRLESWEFWTLSLKGKSMIINTLTLSDLWYTGSIVPCQPGLKRESIGSSLTFCGPEKMSVRCAICLTNLVVLRW